MQMGQYRFISSDELYHYGVKGMKWGVRRYQKMNGSYTKKGVERFKKAEETYEKKRYEELNAKQAYKSGSSSKTIYKNAKKAEKVAERNLKKMEKQEYKAAIKQYRKQINEGASVADRIWNKLTDADKYQAEVMYDMDKRAKVNKTWST